MLHRAQRGWIVVLLVINGCGVFSAIRSRIWTPNNGPLFVDGTNVTVAINQSTSRPMYFFDHPPKHAIQVPDFSELLLPCAVNFIILVIVYVAMGRRTAQQITGSK